VNSCLVSEHTREHNSVLAPIETKTLRWIAERLPDWVNSDHMTVLACGAMACAGASFWLARHRREALFLVVIALAVNWFGDSLDGTLARVRNRQRPRYGYYVDHVVDVAGVLCLFGGLAVSGFMSPLIALGLLAAYLAVAAEVFLATSVHGVFRLSSMGLGPTELRIVLAAGTLYLLRSPFVEIGGHGPYLLFDVGGVIATTGLALAFVISAARNTASLYRAEPPVR
jgi:phosphatidylglycerophosphate synthase